MRKRAFTLIELLVVIAIIAILAAILFPVFAQAKEAAKKTSTLSSIKQTATAILIYSTDGDDNFPNALPIDATGRVVLNFTFAVPAGWDYLALEAADAQAWANAIQPYLKNYQMLAATGMPKYRYKDIDFAIPFTAPYATPRKNWWSSSYTMNGLLSTYNASAVNRPSQTGLVWQGEGKVAGEGYANAHPIMKCDDPNPSPCKFNPNGTPQPGSTLNGNGTADYWWTGPDATNWNTFWTYGRSVIYAATDTSARARPINAGNRESALIDFTPVGTPEMSYSEPFSRYALGGIPRGTWACTSNGTVAYRSFWRPDGSFTYTFGATSLTSPCNIQE